MNKKDKLTEVLLGVILIAMSILLVINNRTDSAIEFLEQEYPESIAIYKDVDTSKNDNYFVVDDKITYHIEVEQDDTGIIKYSSTKLSENTPELNEINNQSVKLNYKKMLVENTVRMNPIIKRGR